MNYAGLVESAASTNQGWSRLPLAHARASRVCRWPIPGPVASAAGPARADNSVDLHFHKQLSQFLLAFGDDEERTPLHAAHRPALFRLYPGPADQLADGGDNHVGGSDDTYLRPAAAPPGAGHPTRSS